MPTSAQIDLERIANDVTAILNARETKSEAAQREAARLATIRAQQADAEALETRKAQSRADNALLERLESRLRQIKSEMYDKAEAWRMLPGAIADLERDLNGLLAERAALRQKLGN